MTVVAKVLIVRRMKILFKIYASWLSDVLMLVKDEQWLSCECNGSVKRVVLKSESHSTAPASFDLEIQTSSNVWCLRPKVSKCILVPLCFKIVANCSY